MRSAAATQDRAAYTNADAELHRTIVGCSRNELLAEIYEHLGGALKPSFTPDLWDQALASYEVDYHVALVDAIEATDAAAAEAAAENLIDLLKTSLLPPDNRTHSSAGGENKCPSLPPMINQAGTAQTALRSSPTESISN